MLDDAKYQKSKKFIVVSQKAPEIGHYFVLLYLVKLLLFASFVEHCKDVFAQK